MSRSSISVACVVAICTLALGCNHSNLVPVRGTVKRDGKVVPGGRVIFAPIGGGQPAHGVLQPDGTFKLTTTLGDGAPVGLYQVSIMGERGSENEATSGDYRGPRDKPVEVVAGKSNEFSINISKQGGWQY